MWWEKQRRNIKSYAPASTCLAATVLPYHPWLPSELPYPSPALALTIHDHLHAGRFAELHALLQAETEAARRDVQREETLFHLLVSDGDTLFAHGAESHARLQQWRQAAPESAQACLLEAAYWQFCQHRLSLFRGCDPQQDRLAPRDATASAASYFSDLLLIAVLDALERDPALWPAPALALFHLGEYDPAEPYFDLWLADLLAGRDSEHSTTSPYNHQVADDDTERAGVVRLLAQAGLPSDSERSFPRQRPASLPAIEIGRNVYADDENGAADADPPQGMWQRLKQGLGGSKPALRYDLDGSNCWLMDYFLRLSQAAHPTVFCVLPARAWHLDDERLQAWLDSRELAHLDETQRALVDYPRFYRWLYHNTGISYDPDAQAGADVVSDRLVQELAKPLRPGQRQYLLLQMLDEMSDDHPQRIVVAREIAETGPIRHGLSTNKIEHGQLKVYETALEHGADWLPAMLERAVHERANTTAMLLYARLAETGEGGFMANPAVAQAWYAEAERHQPQNDAWYDIARTLSDEAAVDFCRIGLHEGNGQCASFLGRRWLQGRVAGTLDDVVAWMELAHTHSMHENPPCLSHADVLLTCYGRQAVAADDEGKRERVLAKASGLITLLIAEDELIDRSGNNLDGLCQLLPWLHDEALLEYAIPLLEKRVHRRRHALAMLALAAIRGNPRNGQHHDYRDGVRWLMAAEAADAEADHGALIQVVGRAVFEPDAAASAHLQAMRDNILPEELLDHDDT
ncbi:DUF4034 domain-containing protein [Chitinolyticbacter albus]|uniref:DUF4034 domain-containing protein n=1 Tax=Chitinolyticbacter albus TaxID=2961951 RepID=UPI00210C89C4|nr:DUF4034 domain-containing protein [Chitinolyticbacter albus]